MTSEGAGKRRQVADVVAGRMRTLRKDRGWTAVRLAEEMRGQGIHWERNIVANIESGRRQSIDVSELLALAVVFDVPPISLLVETAEPEAPITPQLSLPAIHAMEWLTASRPREKPSGHWVEAARPFGELAQVQYLRARLCDLEAIRKSPGMSPRMRTEAKEMYDEVMNDIRKIVLSAGFHVPEWMREGVEHDLIAADVADDLFLWKARKAARGPDGSR